MFFVRWSNAPPHATSVWTSPPQQWPMPGCCEHPTRWQRWQNLRGFLPPEIQEGQLLITYKWSDRGGGGQTQPSSLESQTHDKNFQKGSLSNPAKRFPTWRMGSQRMVQWLITIGDRFRGTLRIGLWDPWTIHGRNLWLSQLGGDSNHWTILWERSGSSKGRFPSKNISNPFHPFGGFRK